jgi:hypothetical protein
MKIIKTVFFLLLFTFFSCATKSNFSKNDLNKEYFKDKTIVFSISENSVKSIRKSGPRAGIEKRPNVNECFQKSLTELTKETKINLRTKYFQNQEDNNSDINVNAEITDISWVFTLSSATMTSTITYKIGNKIYKKVGVFKNMSGGSEKKNLIKSFKSANYSLLKELEK